MFSLYQKKEEPVQKHVQNSYIRYKRLNGYRATEEKTKNKQTEICVMNVGEMIGEEQALKHVEALR